jgi:HEAT repeat protein
MFHPGLLSVFFDLLADDDPNVRQTTAQALGHIGYKLPEIITRLLASLTSSDVKIKEGAIRALGLARQKQSSVLARLFEMLSHTNWQIRTSVIETLGQLGDGQSEITTKFVELLSSTVSDERDAALIALAKQSKEPMQVMDILLKSLVNPIEKRIWRSAISYILASSEIDRVALGQQVEKLLCDHESITENNLTATTQVDHVFFALQQIVGNVI